MMMARDFDKPERKINCFRIFLKLKYIVEFIRYLNDIRTSAITNPSDFEGGDSIILIII